MKDTRRTIVITDLRTQEARDAAAYLSDLGYDVRPVPEGLSLWDEDALKNWTAPFAEGIRAVIHPHRPLSMAASRK